MSELKATTVYDAYWKANSVGEGTGIQVYLKSEADKVIAELEDKARHYPMMVALLESDRKEIAELKRQIEFLKITHSSCGDCNKCADGMGIVFDENLNELKAQKAQLLKMAFHHKYKRCLAMARWCKNEEKRLEAIEPIFDNDKECWEYNSDYWFKWRKRWLELAQKFKPNKEADDGND